MGKRWQVLNRLAAEMGYSSYLEVGVAMGDCYLKVEVPNKTAVDPVHCQRPAIPNLFVGRSDEFFRQTKLRPDLVFVDGDHRCPQVLRDVLNSLRLLAPGGAVLLHDCKPASKVAGSATPVAGAWNGTVWQAFLMLRMTRPDLEMWTMDLDHGIGVVRPGRQPLYEMPAEGLLTWEWFSRDLAAILRLVSEEAFFGQVVPRWKSGAGALEKSAAAAAM